MATTVDELRQLSATARRHAEHGDVELAIASYDAMLRKARETRGGDVWIAAALQNKRLVLQRAGRLQEALTVATETVEQFGDKPPKQYPFLAGDALLAQTVYLRKLGRPGETKPLYERFVAQFGECGDDGIRLRVIEVLVAYAEQLSGERRFDDAIRCIDDVEKKYIDSAASNMLIDGLCIKAEALGGLERWSEALEVDDAVLSQAGDATGGAWPAAHRAIALNRLGRTDEAVEAWERVSERYQDDDSPAVASIVEASRTALRQAENEASGT
jgi:tetratricopeptide (TPR) repeat protein